MLREVEELTAELRLAEDEDCLTEDEERLSDDDCFADEEDCLTDEEDCLVDEDVCLSDEDCLVDEDVVVRRLWAYPSVWNAASAMSIAAIAARYVLIITSFQENGA